MSPIALDPCATVVPGGPTGTSAPQLPATGVDLTSLPWTVLAAVLLVLMGAILLTRVHTPGRVVSGAALVLAATALGVVWAGVSPAAQASGHVVLSSQPCSLIVVSDVYRASAEETGNLLPGQREEVLRVTVTNVTAAPVEVRTSLTPTDGVPSAFVADIATDTGILVAGVLSDAPATSPVSLAPGARLDLTVSVEPAADDAHSGTTSTFDTVFTASGG